MIRVRAIKSWGRSPSARVDMRLIRLAVPHPAERRRRGANPIRIGVGYPWDTHLFITC